MLKVVKLGFPFLGLLCIACLCDACDLGLALISQMSHKKGRTGQCCSGICTFNPIHDACLTCCVCRHLKALLDTGDIVGVTGPMKRTDKGELSIVAQDFQVGGFDLPAL